MNVIEEINNSLKGSMKHRHIVERNEENSSSPESGRRINNENPN